MTGGLANAETPSPVGAIGLGNRGWSAADTIQSPQTGHFQYEVK